MLAAQRDDTFLQLASAQEEASRKAEALHNLQAVLEQFQKGIVISLTAFQISLYLIQMAQPILVTHEGVW